MHLIVDVTGWVSESQNDDSYRGPQTEVSMFALNLGRRVDTRSGLASPATRIGPGETRSFSLGHIGDHGPIFNVTAISPDAESFLTVWGDGDRPETSNLNLTPGRTTAGLVVLPHMGSTFSVYNHAGYVDLAVDFLGAVLPEEGGRLSTPFPRQFRSLSPARVADTRVSGGSPMQAGESRRFPMASIKGLPANGVGSVAVNIIAVQPTASTHLTVWSGAGDAPGTSTVNASPGQTVANSVVAELGPDGMISIHNFAGATDIVIDAVGWFAPPPRAVPAGRIVVDDLIPVDVRFDAVGSVRSVICDVLAGQTVTLKTNNAGSTVAPFGRVVPPDGATMTGEDVPEFTAPVSGTYTVLLSTMDRTTGTSRVTISTTTPR